MVSGSYDGRGRINVMRMRLNVTLYAHGLFCLIVLLSSYLFKLWFSVA